ncbi:MAG TPA: hypothetical protein VEH04_01715 [Verrucomicrobiae bacterium]|nr:hypothetical protein [Verrucomicrobiae bacterium]
MENSPETASQGSKSKSNAQGSHVIDRVLKTETIQIDRKLLICTLKENSHGKFVRISEETGKHHNAIILSAVGIQPLCNTLKGFLQ